MSEKKLYRSASDKKVCGVCAGIAEYIGIDSTLIRLIWLLIALTGTGIIAYFICAIIIPEYPNVTDFYSAPRDDDKPQGGNYN